MAKSTPKKSAAKKTDKKSGGLSVSITQVLRALKHDYAIVGREAAHHEAGNVRVGLPRERPHVVELELEEATLAEHRDNGFHDATEAGGHAAGQDHHAALPLLQ